MGVWLPTGLRGRLGGHRTDVGADDGDDQAGDGGIERLVGLEEGRTSDNNCPIFSSRLYEFECWNPHVLSHFSSKLSKI